MLVGGLTALSELCVHIVFLVLTVAQVILTDRYQIVDGDFSM